MICVDNLTNLTVQNIFRQTQRWSEYLNKPSVNMPSDEFLEKGTIAFIVPNHCMSRRRGKIECFGSPCRSRHGQRRYWLALVLR